MRSRKNKLLLNLSLLCLISLPTQSINFVLADTNSNFTNEENKKINEIKQQFDKLNDQDHIHGAYDIYSVPPNFSYPYNPGFIKKDYIQATTDWINYYRSLINLKPARNASFSYFDGTANTFAQLGAYLLAASNADQNKYQHNLTNAQNPGYIPINVWNQGKPYTNFASLYFNPNFPEENSYFPIATLIADSNDPLSQNATGHRADLLSSRLSDFGVGVAYGTNGTKYEDIYYDNTVNDELSEPSSDIVTYPGANLFPIEELNTNSEDHPIYWSIYFSKDDLIPKNGLSIVLKDESTGTVGDATNVTNIPEDKVAGGYESIITYLPPKNVILKAGDKYSITLFGLDKNKYPNGLYSYSFKLFNETGDPDQVNDYGNTIDLPQEGTATIKSNGQKVPVYDLYTKDQKQTSLSLPDGSTWKYFGISYEDNNYWFNVGNHQWINGQYVESNNYKFNGTATINYVKGYGIKVWNSPYANKKAIPNKLLMSDTKWKTFKVATVNNRNWFNLGGDQWIDGQYVNTNN